MVHKYSYIEIHTEALFLLKKSEFLLTTEGLQSLHKKWLKINSLKQLT